VSRVVDAPVPTVTFSSLAEVLDTGKGKLVLAYHDEMIGVGINPSKSFQEVKHFITQQMQLKVCACLLWCGVWRRCQR